MNRIACSRQVPFCMSCCLSPEQMEKLKVIEPSKENPKAAVIRGVLYLAFTIIG